MTGDSHGADLSLYPDRWLRESRAGYGYITRVPCRVLTQTAERIKILALKANGEVVVRYVKRENIERGSAL